jgi:quinol monooxygenase YgiN
MIFVAGDMTLNPEAMGDFRRDAAALRQKVLQEAGCRHYSLLVEDEAAGVVNVLEMWDDDDALATHLRQPWIAEFFGKFGPQVTAMNLQVYDIAGSRPLPAIGG